MPVPILAMFTAAPLWLKVGAGMGLLMGTMWVFNWWNTRDLKRDLANTKQELKTTQEEAAKDKALRELHAKQEENNRLELEASIEQQNSRISAAAARARQAETAAALATTRAIEEGRLIADALRDRSSTVPVGYDGMNSWTKQRFSEVMK